MSAEVLDELDVGLIDAIHTALRRRVGHLCDRADAEYVAHAVQDWLKEGAVEAFVCPRCGARSWNPHDIAEGYCGRCHWWTGDPLLGQYERLVARAVDRGE